MALPKVAIIYLSYNSCPYLDEVFFALSKLNYPREQLKIFFVDNASSDGSVEMLKHSLLPQYGNKLPQVEVIANEKNAGFAGGNNQGMQQAMDEGFDYIYLHNNDAKLHPECIIAAVRLAESDGGIGAVQSTMLLWQEPDKYNSTGNMYHFLGFGYCRDNGRLISDISRPDGQEIAYPSCAAVLFKTEVLKKIGLFDPHYFMYHEDSDLGLRVKLRGYRNVISAKSRVYHKYEFGRSMKKFYWMERNRLLLLFKTLKKRTLLLLLPALLFDELAVFVLSVLRGWGKEKFLSWVYFIDMRNWAYLFKARVAMQELRVLNDRSIIKNFSSKLDSPDLSSLIVKFIFNPLMTLYWSIIKPLIRW